MQCHRMPWVYLTSAIAWRFAAFAMLALGAASWAGQVFGQSIESVLAPGDVIQGHAKWEGDCKQCHAKFDRQAQSGLCSDCHKEVGSDMKARTGFHGTLKPQPCSACHRDHKGRNAQMVRFDAKRFDHSQSDFTLRGKHQPLECDKCHVAGKKYREAASQCNACHGKDDVHKDSLGTKCADCHNERNWKEASFDHSTSRFVLLGKHPDVKCASCHKTSNYREAPRSCIGCHKKDDENKGHKGQFGEKCETCHGATQWKTISFNHDTDTKYALRGKHSATACTKCHTANLYRVKLNQECAVCHQKDDKHKESLGKDCGSCHGERSWREPAKFDHDVSSFPLLGKHAAVVCKECHKSAMFKDAPRACIGCHRKDDKHSTTLGEACGDCHGERDWKSTVGRFGHSKTRFALRNAHALPSVKCLACHKDLVSFRGTALECLACHRKDDKHEGQLGLACVQCHTDKSWQVPDFDHRQARFALTGGHALAKCITCHATARYKDASRDCFGCHEKDDRHRQKFGTRCEGCHSTRLWMLWDFNHVKRTSYPLDGGHRKVACESCHKLQAPVGKSIAVLDPSCMGCHRAGDVHDGQFGARCEQCHVTESWNKLPLRSGLKPTGNTGVSR